MFCRAACKRLRPRPTCIRSSSKPVRRLFSTSLTSLSLHEQVNNFCTNYSYPFHEFFQYIHEYTHLPWILTIPLGVVLMRSLFLPFRLTRARQDKDRRLAFPLLLLESRIVDRRAALQEAAPDSDEAEISLWKQEEFEARKENIEKQYKHITPGRYELSRTRRSLADPLSGLMLLCNTSTLSYISTHQETLIDLDAGPVTFTFYGILYCLIVSNKAYYQSKIPLSPKTGYFPSQRVDEADKSPVRPEVVLTYLLPCVGVVALGMAPGAAALCVFSSSAYTFLERHVINLLIRMPEGTKAGIKRHAQQSTTTNRARR